MNSPKYNKSILNLYNNEEKVLTKGFVPLANTIHLYKNELGITWKEIGLITSVLASVFQNKPIIKDKDLSPDGKTENEKRSFKRQRRSLKDKNYLQYDIIKDYDNGFRTLGIKYNFTGLFKKIKELVEVDEALNGNVEKPKEKNNENTTINENNFLQEYNKLHKQIVGTEVNFEKQTLYKKYILEHYQSRNRELSEININDIKQAYNHHCLKSPKENNSLSFQDTIKYLFLIPSENKTTTKNRRTPKVKTADEFLNEHNIQDNEELKE